MQIRHQTPFLTLKKMTYICHHNLSRFFFFFFKWSGCIFYVWDIPACNWTTLLSRHYCLKDGQPSIVSVACSGFSAIGLQPFNLQNRKCSPSSRLVWPTADYPSATLGSLMVLSKSSSCFLLINWSAVSSPPSCLFIIQRIVALMIDHCHNNKWEGQYTMNNTYTGILWWRSQYPCVCIYLYLYILYMSEGGTVS